MTTETPPVSDLDTIHRPDIIISWNDYSAPLGVRESSVREWNAYVAGWLAAAKHLGNQLRDAEALMSEPTGFNRTNKP